MYHFSYLESICSTFSFEETQEDQLSDVSSISEVNTCIREGWINKAKENGRDDLKLYSEKPISRRDDVSISKS